VGCGGPEVPRAERPACAARRARGDKVSSREPELRGRWPSPADLRSAASPAARARRYGRCRGRSVERVFTARPELAQFRQGTYHGTNVPALCTDINRKLASAKEHQADALDGRAHLSH
jgi:hypothetical protein